MSFLHSTPNTCATSENFSTHQIETFTKILSTFSYAGHTESLIGKENISIHLKKMMQDIARSQDLLIKRISAGEEQTNTQHYHLGR